MLWKKTEEKYRKRRKCLQGRKNIDFQLKVQKEKELWKCLTVKITCRL